MSVNKCLLILPSSIDVAPYINIYLDLLNEQNIDYDLLYWNRNLDNVASSYRNHIQYNVYMDNLYPYWRKLYKIYGFYLFAKKILKKKQYSFVVVFTIANSIFFSNYLKNNFSGRYILDIRDYSPICENSFFTNRLKVLIKNSAHTVLSSAGFLRWLPNRFGTKYLISHNVRLDIINKSQGYLKKERDVIRILTIGQIRDQQSNTRVIQSLVNDNNYELIFAGAGLAVESLKQFADNVNATNVLFKGRYKKSEENSIVENVDMINVLFSRGINSDTLMSNRFYLSAIFRKPMIVNEGCYQAELVEKYGLGVIIKDGENIKQAIENYWNSFNYQEYDAGCLLFLQHVKNDIQKFNRNIISLLNNKI